MKQMTRFLLLSVVACAVISAKGEGLDTSLGVAGRTRPLGAAIYGNLGYGKLLWGDDKATPIDYGYLRPVLQFASSGVVNKTGVALEFFPIAILGVSGGRFVSFRSIDVKTVDCDQVVCQGTLNGHFVQGHLALGYMSFYTLITQKISWLEVNDRSKPFAEEVSTLVGNPGQDRLKTLEIIAGYEFSKQFGLGLQYQTEQMMDANHHSELQSAYARWVDGEMALTVGAGLFASPTQARGFTAYGLFEWKPRPSMGIF